MQTVSTTQTLHIASIRRSHSIPELRTTTPTESRVTHLSICTAEGILLLPFDEILHCQADSNYCTVYSSSGEKILASKTLKALEAILPETQFVRIHQSHLVRLNGIRAVQKEQVLLMNGECLPVSRSQRAALLDRLTDFSAKI